MERVGLKNVEEILQLRVNEGQESFVASNSDSIIEAYATVADGGHAMPFGLYDGETPVGFVMIGYDDAELFDGAPRIARGNYLIWRLMIDRAWQGRGYGREALALALDYIRTFPCGRADCCWLSYEPENAAARGLYRAFGFVENGEMDGDEIVAVLKL